MSQSKCDIAARVLLHQGHPDTAGDDIRWHLLSIRKRYSEFKITHDFKRASELAHSEWLLKFFQDRQPNEDLDADHHLPEPSKQATDYMKTV